MKLMIFCIFITTVYARNFRNAEFNELPEEKLLDAVCPSFHKKNSTACEEIIDCEEKNVSLKDFHIKQNSATFNFHLLCKENNIAHFQWDSDGKPSFVYFLQASSAKERTQIFSTMTNCNYLTLHNLTENNEYSVKLWAVSATGKLILSSDELLLEVAENQKLSPVTNISLKNLTCEDITCQGIIEWTPNKDYSCFYDLVWLKEGSIYEDSVNVISDSHQAVLSDLKFDASYTVAIKARSQDSSFESQKKLFNFSTPTCLQIYNAVDKCVPEIPKNLIVKETISDMTEEIPKYTIHLTWDKSDLEPYYYIAHFTNLIQQNATERYLNISGDQTEADFQKVILGDLYHISLMACSPAGCSKKIADERHRTDVITIDVSSNHILRILMFIFGPLIIILIAIILITYYRSKEKRKEARERYFMELDEEKIPESNQKFDFDLIKQELPDQWELDPKKIIFQRVIGEGAFGIVRTATLEVQNNTRIEVAVKMLKECPTSDEIRQFTQEINIMKSVRQHPYIVSLIGCITEGRIEGPILVVEYCSRGDLQTYLRNAWEKFCNLQQEMDSEYLTNQKNSFSNRTYDFHNMNLEDDFILQPKHLLSIARQVALGMEHLAKTRVVHRDLAARNVLVCENHTVKVSDFGLSRDVYRDNVYCKKSGGKLPIRWMALESLTHQRYTTFSDVWSFGILLWEIITLGGTPYVGIPTSDLLEFLKSGNRLPCPSNCSPELYAIMESCWKASPKNRPSFTDICKSLEDLLENVSHYLQLQNVDLPLECDERKFSSSKSEHSLYTERYIKPVNTFRYNVADKC